MKKLFKFLGSIIYGAVMFYLLWLLFLWLTPFVMGLKWLGLVIYIVVAGGLVSAFVSTVSMIFGIPLFFLCRNCKAAKYAPIPFGVFFGFSAARLPWGLDVDYGLLQWILGLSLTITIIVTFAVLIFAPFGTEQKSN